MRKDKPIFALDNFTLLVSSGSSRINMPQYFLSYMLSFLDRSFYKDDIEHYLYCKYCITRMNDRRYKLKVIFSSQLLVSRKFPARFIIPEIF